MKRNTSTLSINKPVCSRSLHILIEMMQIEQVSFKKDQKGNLKIAKEMKLAL